MRKILIPILFSAMFLLSQTNLAFVVKTETSFDEDTCYDMYADRIQRILDTLVRKDTWVAKCIELGGFQPTFPDLFCDFSQRKADSIIEICENYMYDTYGPRDSIEGKCRLKRLKDTPEPRELEFCRMLNGGVPMVINYGTTKCDNYLPIIDEYRTYRHLTPRLYQYLELAHNLKTGRLNKSDYNLGLKYNDETNRGWALYSKHHAIRGACLREALDGEWMNIDSVIYDAPFEDWKYELRKDLGIDE